MSFQHAGLQLDVLICFVWILALNGYKKCPWLRVRRIYPSVSGSCMRLIHALPSKNLIQREISVTDPFVDDVPIERCYPLVI